MYTKKKIIVYPKLKFNWVSILPGTHPRPPDPESLGDRSCFPSDSDTDCLWTSNWELVSGAAVLGFYEASESPRGFVKTQLPSF